MILDDSVMGKFLVRIVNFIIIIIDDCVCKKRTDGGHIAVFSLPDFGPEGLVFKRENQMTSNQFLSWMRPYFQDQSTVYPRIAPARFAMISSQVSSPLLSNW